MNRLGGRKGKGKVCFNRGRIEEKTDGKRLWCDAERASNSSFLDEQFGEYIRGLVIRILRLSKNRTVGELIFDSVA